MAGHLRLVKPAGPKPPRERRRERSPFTREEQARIRAALRNARTMFGTWACLAAALYLSDKYVQHVAGGRLVTGCLAVRLARALGKPLESLYAAPSDASRCPHCGASRGSP